MEKLPMCRLCLAENVRMYLVVDKNLYELYERLTDIPFVTEDSRPILACFFCFAQLKKCYQLRTKCLTAEEGFAQIMNANYESKPLINQDHLEFFHGFIKTPIQSINIVDVGQTETVLVKEELPTEFQRQEDTIEPTEDHLSDDDITNSAVAATNNLPPEKSRQVYEKCYEDFVTWRERNNIPSTSFSENVLLVYFEETSKNFKPSSLWTRYSILRNMLNIKHQIDLSKYFKVLSLLKRISEGFKSKKSQTFTPDQIRMFLNEAPTKYLFMKVAFIIGLMGACRRAELHQLEFQNVKQVESTLFVTIPNTITKTTRTFTITAKYAEICMEYMKLRPKNCESRYFFLNYVSGKCTRQRVGINKFGRLCKEIAMYLELPNPHLYTGHCFRRSSATILVDAGGDITSLKRHRGWKSTV